MAPGLETRSQRLAAGALLAGAALLLLGRLGAADLSAPDEPRYAQVAEELRSFQHGPAGLVLLHLNGEPYTQKPPLYFWLAALAGSPSGRVTEVAARLPSALAGVGVVALTLRFGVATLGPPAGLLGAGLLLGMNEFVKRARRAHLDVVLTLFILGALLCYWRWLGREGARRREVLGFHALMGLAVLTKGPVGFLVPAGVVIAHRLMERRGRDLRALFPPLGLLLSIGPGIAWIVAATALAPEGFFGKAVVENVFGRFFAGTSHARPIYMYLYQFPVDALPAFLLFPAVIWMWRRGRYRRGDLDPAAPARRFLWAWLWVPFVFFTLSTGKRGLYLLPVYPATALLLADAWVCLLRERPRSLRALEWGALAAGVLLIGAGAWLAWRPPLGDAGTLRVLGLVVIAAVVASALGWLALARRRATAGARLAWMVASLLVLDTAVFQLGIPALDAERSPRPIAEAASALASPGEPIGLVGRRALLGGIVYYGRRPVVAIRDLDDVPEFVERGGRVLILRAKKVPKLAEIVPVRERFRARSGSGALAVVTVEPREPSQGARGAGLFPRPPLG